MTKKCRECSTVFDEGAPYCDACGCQFSKVPAIRIGLSRTARYRLASIVAGLSVAFFHYFQG